MFSSIKLLIIAAAIFATYASCCKVGCISQEMQITMQGYNYTELDSTLFRRCEANTNFTVVSESFYRNADVLSGTIAYFYLEEHTGLDLSSDYEMALPDSNVHRISNIQTARSGCPCGSGHSRHVAAFKLDGVNYLGKEIIIKR